MVSFEAELCLDLSNELVKRKVLHDELNFMNRTVKESQVNIQQIEEIFQESKKKLNEKSKLILKLLTSFQMIKYSSEYIVTRLDEIQKENQLQQNDLKSINKLELIDTQIQNFKIAESV